MAVILIFQVDAVYVTVLISALALLTSVFSFFYFKSYLKRRTGQERLLSELKDEVNNILNSIDETTERDISLIEEREKDLKSMLNEIDRRLMLYIKELDKKRDDESILVNLSKKGQSGKVYGELGKKMYRLNNTETEAAPKAGNAFPANSRAADKQVAPPEPSPGSGTAVPETQALSGFPLPEFTVSAAPSKPPSVAEQVRELLAQGFSAPVIAGRLGISISEAEFAAALLERRDNSITET